MATPANTPVKEFKILLIGDVRVGKTSFLTRYTRNVVKNNEKPTVGVEYITKNLVLRDGTIAKAKLWDTAGSEKYLSLTTASTYDHVSFWLEEIENHAEKETIVMLIGNKCDLVKDNPDDRQVSVSEAESFAKKNGLMYNETSATTGHNVKEAFENLIETIHESQKRNNASDKKGDKLNKRVHDSLNKKADGGEEKKNDSCC